MSKAHLYINSKGYPVTYHSYSGSDSFNGCNRKYYLERVQGWTERTESAAKFFGTCVEQAVQYYHQRAKKIDDAIVEFTRLWEEHKDKPYRYGKTERDWKTLSLNGQEMVRLYAILYPNFPYTVPEPRDAFQVKDEFEVFPGTKLAGINFTAYIDLLAQDKESAEPVIIDLKVSGAKMPELVVLDPQLRAYAWERKSGRVGFLWFHKAGRLIKKGDTVYTLESVLGIPAGTEVEVTGSDAFGLLVDTGNGITGHISESRVTKQSIQFKSAIVPEWSREDAGKSIKHDIISIASATEHDFFPMHSGVRWPNNRCDSCQMRGICSGDDALRDQLVTRKHKEELEFGSEEE